MTVPIFANDVSIPNEKLDKVTNALDTLIIQHEQSLENQTKIIEFNSSMVLYIKLIIVLALLVIAFFLAYLFVKKIAIKILNITTKGMSL